MKMASCVDFARCSVEGCEKKKVARGWCDTHYRRWRIHGDATCNLRKSRRNLEVVLLRNHNGDKHCVTCDQWLSEDMFYSRNTTADKLSYRCKLCDGRAVRNARYKINVDDLLFKQNGKCNICNDELELFGMNSYVVDHDHNCCPTIRPCGKCVRGLLCRKCNTGLGAFVDDTSNLRRAAEYLERFTF